MNLKINIAVVDDGGHLLSFDRMNGARPASGYTAITKATTAATFRQASGPIPAGTTNPDPLLNLSLQIAAQASGGKLTTLYGGIPDRGRQSGDRRGGGRRRLRRAGCRSCPREHRRSSRRSRSNRPGEMPGLSSRIDLQPRPSSKGVSGVFPPMLGIAVQLQMIDLPDLEDQQTEVGQGGLGSGSSVGKGARGSRGRPGSGHV